MRSADARDVRDAPGWGEFASQLESPHVALATEMGSNLDALALSVWSRTREIPPLKALLCVKEVRADTGVERRRSVWPGQSISVLLGAERREVVTADDGVCATGVAALSSCEMFGEALRWAANGQSAVILVPESTPMEEIVDRLAWVPAEHWIGYWPRLVDSVVSMDAILVRVQDEHGTTVIDLFGHQNALVARHDPAMAQWKYPQSENRFRSSPLFPLVRWCLVALVGVRVGDKLHPIAVAHNDPAIHVQEFQRLILLPGVVASAAFAVVMAFVSIAVGVVLTAWLDLEHGAPGISFPLLATMCGFGLFGALEIMRLMVRSHCASIKSRTSELSVDDVMAIVPGSRMFTASALVATILGVMATWYVMQRAVESRDAYLAVGVVSSLLPLVITGCWVAFARTRLGHVE